MAAALGTLALSPGIWAALLPRALLNVSLVLPSVSSRLTRAVGDGRVHYESHRAVIYHDTSLAGPGQQLSGKATSVSQASDDAHGWRAECRMLRSPIHVQEG